MKAKLGNPAIISAVASNPKAVSKITDTASGVVKVITVIGVAAGLFAGYKIYRFFNPNTAAAAQELADQQGDLNDVTTDFNLQSVAESLTVYLGTKYPSWDPRNWTESDQKVADLIIATRNDFTEVAKLYAVLVGRNLRSDLIEMLDSSELDRVKQYINL